MRSGRQYGIRESQGDASPPARIGVKEHSGHQSGKTFNEYVEEAGTFQDNPAEDGKNANLVETGEGVRMGARFFGPVGWLISVNSQQ